jgi:hypothetical protein
MHAVATPAPAPSFYSPPKKKWFSTLSCSLSVANEARLPPKLWQADWALLKLVVWLLTV